jgi:integrase
MAGTTYKRCSCVDPETGRQVGTRCLKLTSPRHGRWYFTLDIRDETTGRRRQIRRGGFLSQREATAAKEQLQQELADSAGRSAPSLTVGAWLEQWVSGRVRLRQGTAVSYHQHLRLYLKPALGAIPLSQLRTTDIENLYRAMRNLGRDDKPSERLQARLIEARHVDRRESARPLSAASILRVHSTLRAALNAAVRRRLIPHNVASYVELESGRRPPARVWTPEQLGRFLDHLEGDRLLPLFHLISYLGLRRGEACGLRWEDVDLDTGFLRVAQQLTQVKSKLVFGPPKSRAGVRVVTLDEDSVAVLRTLRARQNRERLAFGPQWPDGGLVFTREDGEPVRPDSVSQKFDRLLERLDLPRIRLHDLRHTSASIGLASGETLKEISERLGHSSLGITADTYTHVLPVVALESAKRRARLIPRASMQSDQDHVIILNSEPLKEAPESVDITAFPQVNTGGAGRTRTCDQGIMSLRKGLMMPDDHCWTVPDS